MSPRIYSSNLNCTNTPGRIMLIGCGGSGKTTLSKKVKTITNLPLVHLDKAYWLPNWTEPSKEDWTRKVTLLASEEKWILEGNYSGTFPIRLKRADLVIWLDTPMPICLWRAIKRSIINFGKLRPDIGSGCREKLSIEFFFYIFKFPWVGRKRLIKRLAASPFDFEVIQLKDKREANQFLNDLKRKIH
ncbi:hypothetical protein OAF63_03050 [Saprospiraceae bacterium]|nr:hypothetical protein [Bacteroidota bacterium]MDB4727744.1 hypothetical protein [Saprospiraceae bacterium]MDF1863256.1 hypothetical protein [Saprospiraceae bacterium]